MAWFAILKIYEIHNCNTLCNRHLHILYQRKYINYYGKTRRNFSRPHWHEMVIIARGGWWIWYKNHFDGFLHNDVLSFLWSMRLISLFDLQPFVPKWQNIQVFGAYFVYRKSLARSLAASIWAWLVEWVCKPRLLFEKCFPNDNEIQLLPIHIHLQATACKWGWLKYERGLSNKLHFPWASLKHKSCGFWSGNYGNFTIWSQEWYSERSKEANACLSLSICIYNLFFLCVR